MSDTNPYFILPVDKEALLERLAYLGNPSIETPANDAPGIIGLIALQKDGSALLGIARTSLGQSDADAPRLLVRLSPGEQAALVGDLKVHHDKIDHACNYPSSVVWPLGAESWTPASMSILTTMGIMAGAFDDIELADSGDTLLYATDYVTEGLTVVALNADHRDKLIKILEVL